MSEHKPLLIEVGCEELPPKALDELADSFQRILVDEMNVRYFPSGKAHVYATPRRLAVEFEWASESSPIAKSIQRGVPVRVGWDQDQRPTQALVKKAAQLNVPPGAFRPETDDPGAMLVCEVEIGGEPLAASLEKIVERALKRLPIPKPMRWGDHDYAFVRPVHWVVVLHGSEIIDVEIFGIRSGRQSRGHRFHHPQPVHIADAQSYVDALRAANVLVDRSERRARIRTEVERVGETIGGAPRLRPELLDEIANLTEWPVAIACTFDREFLQVPQEALIQTMETNQKFVPVFDTATVDHRPPQLSEHFIGIANIESKDPSEIRKGYERVIRPRFADAKFFYDEDLKTPLAAQQEALKTVTYQQQLGSLWDKCLRVIDLARVIANRLGVDAALATRAASLSKCDLMTRMVGEFPELQGVMGRYYATANGENAEVAQALDEFYKPRFARDAIAAGKLAQVLAVAERLDTLAGIFAVGMKPSGSKDPFALRRAALGLGRTLIEGELDLNIEALLREAVELLPAVPGKSADRKSAKAGAGAQAEQASEQQQTGLSANDKSALTDELQTFVCERLRGYYADQGFSSEQFDAVRAVDVETLIDFDRRLRAVAEFSQLPDAQALAAANKRIGNILRQAGGVTGSQVDAALLDAGAETELHGALAAASAEVAPLVTQGRYVDILRRLALLRAPIDRFFDSVMVMSDDAAKRGNRLALLGRLRGMFLHVADISLLPAPERGNAGNAS